MMNNFSFHEENREGPAPLGYIQSEMNFTLYVQKNVNSFGTLKFLISTSQRPFPNEGQQRLLLLSPEILFKAPACHNKI